MCTKHKTVVVSLTEGKYAVVFFKKHKSITCILLDNSLAKFLFKIFSCILNVQGSTKCKNCQLFSWRNGFLKFKK